MNKASKVKFVLGMIAMSSIAALAPAANAATLKSNQALGDVLSQAKLNLDSPTQQQATSTSPSLEKLQQVALRKSDLRCDGGGSSNGGGC
ncbi:hypothetical protein NIES4075_60130 [Tolypothrix sp. NIES-4075]|uniref:hypothetical protein n=1 Tax=Tolypothrix sp. NIES-4075 TaxID=2005459 RepID=UPI000B5CD8B4|nr:hypothetical protein [Tolypothrix sp. NIES-4075]GAX44994.1 hypothetical protein NIES4075_60130 [Tolypothrix sp. NIES-4075]